MQSGGEVINLPTHTFPTDDGGVDLKCPTEIAISDRREAELAKSGLIPLMHRKNTDKAAFIGAQSLYKPKAFFGKDGVEATASDNLSARLPYMFAVSRFAHYLKCMVRDKVGSTKEKDQLKSWLQSWIYQYVDGDPANSSEQTKARKPLAEAGSTSWRTRRTRATTRRGSTCARTTSSRGWTSASASSRGCRPKSRPFFFANWDRSVGRANAQAVQNAATFDRWAASGVWGVSLACSNKGTSHGCRYLS